ncbi:MAG: DNA repair protein RecO [Candidimonas sp.]|nr:MAG: DNA repair protein RecO [Candidimonas sp.]
MVRQMQRVHEAPGYLLHATAWRETSLVVQVFARDYGRLALIAKGAKRPYSVLRPVLMAFQPLSLHWSGGGEVKTLSRAECDGVRPLAGRAMMSAWYMNELLLRLLPREDPYPEVYDAYDVALAALSRGAPAAAALRRFEWVLLTKAGYGLDQEAPDFDDAQAESALRGPLRERLDALLAGHPLQTRKVLMALQRY